jgi:hypothetical protein
MAIEINTKVSVLEPYRNNIPNIVLEDAKFFGRPNFKGEMDRFNDNRRKFTVLIPNDVADQLRSIGYNVKTDVPTPEQVADGRETISHLKVYMNFTPDEDHPDDISLERGPKIRIIQNEEQELLSSHTVAILDRARLEVMDMEIRGWEFNKSEKPGEYSARLVELVATLRPSMMDAKYGRI